MYDTHCNSMYNSTAVTEGLWRPASARGDICGEVIVVGVDIEDDVAFIGLLGCQGSPGKVPQKKKGRYSGRLKRKLIQTKVRKKK